MADVSGNLFGTTRIGFADQGTVFEIPKTATGYGAPTTLAIFNGTNGANPDGALIANAAGDLFGTTSAGSTTASGLPGSGTVFEIPYQGNGVYGAVTTLVTFNGTGPHAGLLADTAGNLFGTTSGPLGQGGTVLRFPKAPPATVPSLHWPSSTGPGEPAPSAACSRTPPAICSARRALACSLTKAARCSRLPKQPMVTACRPSYGTLPTVARLAP